MQSEIKLPSKIFLEEFKGDFLRYFEAVYKIFKEDYVDSKPTYNGKELKLKKHPYIEGKEYTFYHLTHSGKIETDRKPDLRRMERIAWSKPIIENGNIWGLKIWPQKRNGKNRICIWLEAENDLDYIVILDVRINYSLIWTAFVLEYSHEKRKKQREYNTYLKSKNRLNN